MKAILPLIFLFSCNLLFAQGHPTCDGQRYRTQVFDEVQVTTALKFGEGTTINGVDQELFLDIYEPVGDDAEMRPVIILAFGGSYIGGNRGDMDWICERYAKRGFVAVAIDYRLYDLPLLPFPTEEEMIDVVTKSVSDMKASIRYMREDAATENLFKIDPDFVYVGGISAGAITAAHTAVMDSTDVYTDQILGYIDANGGFTGNSSDNHQYSTEVQGFVNLSGGLHDAGWMDAEDPPFVSVHDDGDNIVPYGGAYASILNVDIIYMEGSSILKEVGDSLEIENALETIEGSNAHVSYFGSTQSTDDVMDFTAGFLHDLLCGPLSSTSELDTEMAAIELFPNPTNGMLFLENQNNWPLRLSLFNGLGQQLKMWEDVSQIDLTGMASGVYFIQLENKKTGQRELRKIQVGR